MNWCLFDVLTIVSEGRIYLLQITAQKYSEFKVSGDRFEILINNNIEISPVISRQSGFAQQDFLSKGVQFQEALHLFSDYLSGVPIVAYDMKLSYDTHLVPCLESSGVNLASFNNFGFSMKNLVERVLDPLPTRSGSLKSICAYHKIDVGEYSTASQNIDILVRLLDQVIFPLSLRSGLESYNAINEYLVTEWFPSQLSFGKYKGRNFREARNDDSFLSWLEYTANQGREISPAAQWYLDNLDTPEIDEIKFDHNFEIETPNFEQQLSLAQTSDLPSQEVVLWMDQDVEKYQHLIASARNRIEHLEANLEDEKIDVIKISSKFSEKLAPFYKRREILNLRIEQRNRFIELFIKGLDGSAKDTLDELDELEAKKESEFDRTTVEDDSPDELSEDDEQKIKDIHRALVKKYHPDKNADKPEYLDYFNAIDHAKKQNNLAFLEQVFNDPSSFELLHHEQFERSESVTAKQLSKLLNLLEEKIFSLISELDSLKESPEYEIAKLAKKQPDLLDNLIEDRRKELESSINELEIEARELELKIEELDPDLD